MVLLLLFVVMGDNEDSGELTDYRVPNGNINLTGFNLKRKEKL
jgi:hypothetical protein